MPLTCFGGRCRGVVVLGIVWGRILGVGCGEGLDCIVSFHTAVAVGLNHGMVCPGVEERSVLGWGIDVGSCCGGCLGFDGPCSGCDCLGSCVDGMGVGAWVVVCGDVCRRIDGIRRDLESNGLDMLVVAFVIVV